MPAPATDYLTIADVAKRFGVNNHTVRRWIARGRLPAYRLGTGHLRIRAEDLDTLLTRVPVGGDAA